MNIVFVTMEVFGGAFKGGGERYVSETASALATDGVSVQVVIAHGYRRMWLDEHRGRKPISLFKFLRMARAADAIHVHQLNSHGFDISLLARLLTGTPLVLTDHGGGARCFGRLLGRLRLKAVDGGAFVSEWSRRDIDPSGAIHPYVICYGGGDHFPSFAGSETKRYTFGFVGRLLPHKGAHIAIEALPHGASLAVVGQARDLEYLAQLNKLAEGRNVVFVLDADDSQVRELYADIGYLLVPSVDEYRGRRYTRPELLGLVALEALYAGVPVIGSDVGGLGEILRSSGQTLVPPGDLISWRAALEAAVGARREVLDTSRFSWRTVARCCADLYRRVQAGL